MRLEELLFRHAARRPGHEAVVCGDRRVTYDQLRTNVEKQKGESRVGERVALDVPNSIEFVERAYAAWAAGAVVVPINMRLAPPEIAFIREDIASEAKSEADDCLILYTSGTTGRPKAR